MTDDEIKRIWRHVDIESDDSPLLITNNDDRPITVEMVEDLCWSAVAAREALKPVAEDRAQARYDAVTILDKARAVGTALDLDQETEKRIESYRILPKTSGGSETAPVGDAAK